MKSDGNCRSCGERIRWAKFVDTGKMTPLNASADVHGNIGVVEWGPYGRGGLALPIIMVNPDRATETPFRYTSHFATCPTANEHRRREAE